MGTLSSTGYLPETLVEILGAVNDELETTFGPELARRPQAVLQQVIAPVVERLADLEDLIEAVYAARDPDQATGASLAAVCAITGTLPEAASYSTVVLTMTGTPLTSLPTGRQVSSSGTGTIWETTEDVIIGAADAWVALTPYVVGNTVCAAGARIYRCTTAGTSDVAAPTATTSSVVDGTVTWTYVGAGSGYADADSEPTETGPLEGAARTITTIETPVGGWTEAINLNDATLGADAEADTDLRIRREEEVAGAARSPLDGIRAAVLRVDDVTYCRVFENYTDVTDGDGVPPHSVEVLVLGGATQDILDAIFASKAAGIRPHGTTSGTVTDSAGYSHTMAFTRPTEIDIWVAVTLTKQATLYPTTGDADVKTAVVTKGDTLGVGYDVFARQLVGAIYADVEGVLNVSACNIGIAPAPGAEATVTIGAREIAVFDTSRVTVSSSNATP